MIYFCDFICSVAALHKVGQHFYYTSDMVSPGPHFATARLASFPCASFLEYS